MHTAWTDYQFNINCGGPQCTSSTYAYVYPTDSNHNVYLCPVGLGASVTRAFDSLPGTLIHETAHFDDVIGNGDYGYGQTAAQNLAINSPSYA